MIPRVIPARTRPSRALGFALAACIGIGCGADDGTSPIAGRVVATRVTDVLYAAGQAVPGSTARYPRATLADDIRVVLPPVSVERDSDARRTDVAVVVDLPPEARLELGYGTAAPAGAAFRVTARRWGFPHEVFAAAIGAGETAGWREAVVDLAGWQGRTVLRFTATPAAGAREAAWLADPVITVPQAKPSGPGLVLVSLDTLRADHVGLYGYGRPTSPNLDRLFGTSGTVVDRVLTQATDTFNAHMALMTCMNPTTALHRRSGQLSRQLDWVVTLAEVLRRHGYRTAAFTEDAMLLAGSGFQRGFDVYRESKTIAAPDSPRGTIEETFGHGLAWLEQHRTEPFLLFLHTYQVHDPYLSPPEYGSRFPTPPDAGEPRQEMDRYDRAIAYADEQVRALVARVDVLGVADRTVLVVTADHGEEFGEHGGRRHGAHLTSEVLHVPLLLRGLPGVPAGTRRSGPMGLVDLMPTLLAALGVEAPAQCEGRSMLAHLRAGTPAEPTPLYSESHAPYASTYSGLDETWQPPGFASTTWPYRIVRLRTSDGARVQVFDLDRDPDERHDLAGDAGIGVDANRAALEAYEARCLGQQQTLAVRFTGRGEDTGPERPAVDPAAAAKLKALGYVQ